MQKLTFITEIDNKRAQKELDQLNKKILKTQEQLNSATDKKSGIETQLNEAGKAADETKKKIASLRDEIEKSNSSKVDEKAMQDLYDQRNAAVGRVRELDTPDIRAQFAAYSDAKNMALGLFDQLKQAEAALARATEPGSNVEEEKIEKMQAAVDELTQRSAEASQKAEELKIAWQKAAKESGLTEAREDVQAIDEEIQRLKEHSAEISGKNTAELTAQLKEQETILAGQEKEVATIQKQYDTANSKVLTITANLERQQAAAGQVEQKMSSAFNLGKLRAAGDQLQTSLKGGFKTVLKYGLGVRSIYILVRKLKTVLLEGIKQFAEYDPKTKSLMNSLKNAANELKASFVSAFVPLAQSVMPVLTKIMNTITRVIDYIGMLFAALRGDKSYRKATVQSVEYAEALENEAKAAKKAKQYLSGLDEIRVYSEESESSSSNGASGSQYINGVEEVAIPEKISKIGTILRIIKGDIRDTLKDIKDVWSDIFQWIGDFFSDTWESMQRGWSLIGKGIKKVPGIMKEEFENIWRTWKWLGEHVGQFFSDTWDSMQRGWSLIGKGISTAKERIGEKLGEIKKNLKSWASQETIWSELFRTISDFAARTREECSEMGRNFSNWFNNEVKPWFTAERWLNLGRTALENVKSALNGITWFDPLRSWWNEKVAPWFTWSKWSELGRSAIQGIKNGLSVIRLPRFHLSWGSETKSFRVLGQTISMYIPWPQLQFYARGGIVDGATLFGRSVVGEDGKEAIIPLEHHTEWITRVAKEISDLLVDDLGAFFSQMALPSVVSGTLIPPKIEIDIDGLDAIDSKLAQILDRMGARGGDYRFTAQINRRTLFEEVIAEAKLKQQTTGKNPLMYL